MKFRDPGAKWRWPAKCHPKHKQPKALGSKKYCSYLMDPFYIHTHSVLAYASLGDFPMMKQRRTHFFLFTDVTLIREEVMQSPYFLLNPVMPRSSSEYPPNSKSGLHSHMPAVRSCVRHYAAILL